MPGFGLLRMRSYLMPCAPRNLTATDGGAFNKTRNILLFSLLCEEPKYSSLNSLYRLLNTNDLTQYGFVAIAYIHIYDYFIILSIVQKISPIIAAEARSSKVAGTNFCS